LPKKSVRGVTEKVDEEVGMALIAGEPVASE
jgi:hypothetical protein